MTQGNAVSAAVSVIDYTIGENADRLRRRAGLTVGELGARFGVSPSAMSLKLQGKRGWSAFDTQKAARLFGVSFAQMVGETPLPGPDAPATVVDIADFSAKRGAVGPEGLEPPASSVKSRALAEVLPFPSRAS